MKTAAIPYRVADFLKNHPPFQSMEEKDLVALASRGRVKFHEPDEYICWQGSPHGPFVFVIQQGTVALWDESAGDPALRDIRGAGDAIGFERFNGAARSLHSAKASSEVVLYALHAEDFQALLPRYPAAAQYVAAHSAVTADYEPPGERRPAHEIELSELVGDRAPVHCPASTPIREAARMLLETGAHALVLHQHGEFAGFLTPPGLLQQIAAGTLDPHAPASTAASRAVLTVAPQTSVSECVLAMARSRTGAAAVTGDGSPRTPVRGVITSSSLVKAFGDHPMAILDEIDSAPAAQALARLNRRSRDWILDHLRPGSMDWLAVFSDLVNRRLLERLLRLLAADSADTLWCFCGAAGRQELLTSAAPGIAVIGQVPAALEDALAECGFLHPGAPAGGTLQEWKARFSGWIRDPIRTQVHLSRPFFDLRPLHGPDAAFRELEDHIRAELSEEPAFLQIVSHDCLASLPPLTFFRDLVVEESGERSDVFRLESSALQPLADVARVYSLACGRPLGGSTRDRFEAAGKRLSGMESLFREAAETMRVMMYHQARAGLRLGSDGAAVPLTTLSRHDRQALKSGFRSIHHLLEFTAGGQWLEEM